MILTTPAVGIDLDAVARAVYESKFEIDFLRAKGNEFQTLFADIMELCYRNDFRRTVPWGRIGDQKCDGYLSSQRKVFAVYGPKDMERVSVAAAKIRSDHRGAVKHWRKYCDRWTLVHNQRDGLPTPIVQLIEKLQNHKSGIETATWGYPEMLTEFRHLSAADLRARYGEAVGVRQMLDVRPADIQHVICDLSVLIAVEVPDDDARPVPVGKMEWNRLSGAVQTLLRGGGTCARKVERFFNRDTDPELGGRIAARFREKYTELRDQGLDPNWIFYELQMWTSGGHLQDVRTQAAVLAVLAYLFETCHIFERPAEEAQLE